VHTTVSRDDRDLGALVDTTASRDGKCYPNGGEGTPGQVALARRSSP
jgi:hypothetical protein